MKKTILSAMILFIGMPLCQAQFSADLAIVQPGDKRIYKVQSNGIEYRYDFEEDGMKGSVIVDPAANRTERLYANETEKFGSYFEPGDDVIIEVHEGTILIEISKEKR